MIYKIYTFQYDALNHSSMTMKIGNDQDARNYTNDEGANILLKIKKIEIIHSHV